LFRGQGLKRKVTQGHYTNKAPILHDTKTADLLLAHERQRLVCVRVRANGNWIGCHVLFHTARGRLRVCRDAFDHYVTVGDNADQSIAVEHRQHSDILGAHNVRCLLDAIAPGCMARIL
jgi:hypothetical protein